MNNLPGGPELLTIAREALMADLLPLAHGDARYTLLMVANAMAIAAREAADGDAQAQARLSRLEKLYGETSGARSGADLESQLAEHERRLAQDIRAGRFDANDDRQRAMLEYLRESVAARLRISNPKALGSSPAPGTAKSQES
jgi:hypothetical protein